MHIFLSKVVHIRRHSTGARVAMQDENQICIAGQDTRPMEDGRVMAMEKSLSIG